jgi:malic enzyme
VIGRLQIVGKKIEEIRIVVNGAGASANACANLAISLNGATDEAAPRAPEWLPAAEGYGLDLKTAPLTAAIFLVSRYP